MTAILSCAEKLLIPARFDRRGYGGHDAGRTPMSRYSPQNKLPKNTEFLGRPKGSLYKMLLSFLDTEPLIS